MNDKKGGFLSGLIFGALVGGAAYYIFGTEKGRKLQKEFKKKAKPYLEDLSDVLDNLQEEKAQIVQKAGMVKESLEEKLEEVKELGENVGEAVEDNLPHIQALQKRGRAVAKRFFKGIKKTTTGS